MGREERTKGRLISRRYSCNFSADLIRDEKGVYGILKTAIKFHGGFCSVSGECIYSKLNGLLWFRSI